MRCLFVVLMLAPVAWAQTPEEKAATLKYIESLRDRETGGFQLTPTGKPSVRACNAAVKAIKYLGGTLTEKEKVSQFILSCYDPKTGTFAEPGGKADFPTTAIGLILACELEIPKEKFRGALTYLGKNAKEFEEIRIGAAAVEAWGVRDCPIDVKPWIEQGLEIMKKLYNNVTGNEARMYGSLAAMFLRLEVSLGVQERQIIIKEILDGQLPDGAWGKSGQKTSDIETTYRVMRALHLLKAAPKDGKKLREFLATFRNKDGGYATEPGKPSSMSGVYYATIIGHWLDGLEKK